MHRQVVQPTFLDFLNSDDIKPKVQNNLLVKEGSADPAGAISRIFNNTGRSRQDLQELTSAFFDAFKNNELEAWYNVLLAHINADLLNTHGSIKLEITEYIEKLIGKDKWAKLTEKLSPSEIARCVITSYILEFVCGDISRLCGNQIVNGNFTLLDARQQKEMVQLFKLLIQKLMLDQNHRLRQEFTTSPENIYELIQVFQRVPHLNSFLEIFGLCMRSEISDKMNRILKLGEPAAFVDSIQSVNSYLFAITRSPCITAALNTHASKYLLTHKIDEVDRLPTVDDDLEDFGLPSEDTDISPLEREKLFRDLEAAREKNTITGVRVSVLASFKEKHERVLKENAKRIASLEIDISRNLKKITDLTFQLDAVFANRQQQTDLNNQLSEENVKRRQEIDSLQAENSRLDSQLKTAKDVSASALLAKQQADTNRALALIAQQQADADRTAALIAQQQAQEGRAAALIAQDQAEAARNAALRAQRQAEADRNAALLAQQQAVTVLNAALLAKQRAEADSNQANKDLGDIRSERARELIAEAQLRSERDRQLIAQAPLRREQEIDRQVQTQRNLDLQPVVLFARNALENYIRHLADDLPHGLRRNMDAQAERVSNNEEAHNHISYSARKALIKIHSCNRLLETLSGPATPSAKISAFYREYTDRGRDHRNKLEMRRTHQLWTAVKAALSAFTLFTGLLFFKVDGKKVTEKMDLLISENDSTNSTRYIERVKAGLPRQG